MGKTLITATALFLIVANVGLAFATDSIPGAREWQQIVVTTRDPPLHSVYSGPMFLISGNKNDPGNAVFGIWMKAEYKDPQPLNNHGFYKAEIMLLRLDCKKHNYSIMRDIKFDLNGKVLIDSTKHTSLKYFNINFSGDTGLLPLDVANAVVASSWACFPPAE
ncbi:MAG: hypothetical protein KGI33_12420 [Thaumarchaeota archaeon]|nr:hypothetical protein [Nitrososphaerota archaeon]